jgi:hypothetical protein
MTEAQLTAFVQLLAHSKGSATTLAYFFDDAMEALAKTSAPFVGTDTDTTVAATAVYSYPTGAVRILAVFIDGELLPYATFMDLENYSTTWKNATASDTHLAWTTEEQDAKTIRIWPTPSAGTKTITFLFATTRTTDLPEFCILPIAFEMLYQEFAYPSDHQDFEFSQLCKEFSAVLKTLIRI